MCAAGQLLLVILIRLTHANVWESMGKPCMLHAVHKKPYFLLQVTRESISVCKSCENPYQVLQVTCNEIEGSYDKIIITIVPSYTGKNITRLLPLALLLVLRTCNNTDGNKLVIFSSIAWYYGDTYLVLLICVFFCSSMNLFSIRKHIVLGSIKLLKNPVYYRQVNKTHDPV